MAPPTIYVLMAEIANQNGTGTQQPGRPGIQGVRESRAFENQESGQSLTVRFLPGW
jgi:hypothetical protein